jgi:hypothetical protein
MLSTKHMKKRLFLLMTFALLSAKMNAQVIPDSIRYRVQQVHYQRLLGIEASVARQVAIIQDDYKTKLADVFGRFDLDAQGKVRFLSKLDSTRLVKLGSLLDPKQLSILKKVN